MMEPCQTQSMSRSQIKRWPMLINPHLAEVEDHHSISGRSGMVVKLAEDLVSSLEKC